MTQLAKLKAARTIYDVAALLEYKASALAYILYKKPQAEKYQSFEIPKKSGGVRKIEAPAPDLKQLQRRLSNLLQNCQESIKTGSGKKDNAAHGFVRGRSIISNAYGHRRRRYVFNLDLNDFFGSINFGRVRGYFISDKSFQLDSKVATIIAQIACHNNQLPQGSPCSPVISNLIGHILDVHLVRLAKRHGVHYTRYVDDITFSTNKREFPKAIAEETSSDNWQLGAELRHLLASSGFLANPVKTRMQYKTSRQEVTGLVVNKKVNVPSTYRRQVRAMVHHLFTSGNFEVDGVVGKMDQLHGKLGFIDSIDLYNRSLVSSSSGTEELSKKESMYHDFLLYKEFFASPRPVIICEGKTDNIYLKLAIRALAKSFPALATVDEKGEISRTVRIYRYAETSTGRILNIHGGNCQLGKLLLTYIAKTRKFAKPEKQYPFIFLVDNDSGSTNRGGVFPAIKGATKGAMCIDRSAPYTHVAANLFVVPTPLRPGSADSEMEDFFDDETKSIIIGGKSFDSSNDGDTATHYGKHVFSQKVVLANYSKIDFSGFNQILKNISDVIESYGQPPNP